MSGLRHLQVGDLLIDVRNGLTRLELMRKYGLTSRELHRVFGRMVAAGIVTVQDLPEKLPFQYATLAQDNIRDLFRYGIDFQLPVYDVSDPEILGKIRDITREGVGLAGVKARVGEIKRLVILGDTEGTVDPFEFEGKCRWFRRCGSREDHVSGFQITRISREDLQKLEHLIHVVSEVR